MVQPWCEDGAALVRGWCSLGARMVQSWCEDGAGMVRGRRGMGKYRGDAREKKA
jgi:hypothetical protein